MPLILPARTLDTASYEISNSLRFNDGDSPYLNKTPSSASNRRTFTISLWAKRSDLDVSAVLYGAGSAATDMFQLLMQNTGQILIQNRVSGTNNLNFATSALFRDPSAWYHIVLAIDTTQGTDSNRAKLYVNGTQITDFSNETYPSQNYDCHINNTVAHHIAAQSRGSANDHFDGYIAELYSIDGSQKAPTDFGEFNNNGVWIPKEYSGTYGTNGFFMEFKQTGTSANSSGMGADTSGNTNHFAVTNLTATDQTTDSPTNNWCTWNPLIGRAAAYATFAEGNLDADFTSGSVYWRATGSIGVTSGKWYAEIKCIDDGVSNDLKIGVEHASPDQTTIDGVHKVIESFSGNKASGGSASSYGDTYTNGDIIGVLLDMDNGTIKFSKNGTIMASGASAFTDLISAMPESGWAFFAYGYDNANVQANFGNAPFSISSGNSDANGYGNFEYAVPSGYYSLCTKNLAEYG